MIFCYSSLNILRHQTGNKTRLFALTTLIPHEVRKIYKKLTDWKEKRTLDLFTGDIIIYGEIPNEFTKKLL